jgi:hypothetical protein
MSSLKSTTGLEAAFAAGSLLPYPHHVAGPDRAKRRNRGWHEQLQVAETVGSPAENHERNAPSGQILLIGNVLVRCDENFEAGRLAGC